ncbi:MAG TPA: RNA 2',3'-cyclic phosphodiesterase, partial [Actinomycetota bacterium]|nr:RNA 2',3'-cyclic phosphodiesterase [Actinomycetota bacterium]
MRLFVAVDLPATVKDELDRLIAALRPSIPDAKWVPRDNIHLTLSFLGEVGDERVEPIVEALRGVAASRARIATRL